MQNRGKHDFSNNYRPSAQTLSYCYRMYHACVSAPTRKCIGWWRLPPASSRVWAIMRRPAAWSHQDEEQMVHLFTSKHKTLNQCRLNVGPASSTMGQYWAGNGSSLLFALQSLIGQVTWRNATEAKFTIVIAHSFLLRMYFANFAHTIRRFQVIFQSKRHGNLDFSLKLFEKSCSMSWVYGHYSINIFTFTVRG